MEMKKELDEAYLEAGRLRERMKQLHTLLLRRFVEKVSKNGLQLSREECAELGISTCEHELECCRDKVFGICGYNYDDYEYNQVFDLGRGWPKTIICLSCGQLFQLDKTCPHCGKSIKDVQGWAKVTV